MRIDRCGRFKSEPVSLEKENKPSGRCCHKMELSKIIIISLFLIIGSGPEEIQAKCTEKPAQGEIRHAYVCVNSDLNDINEIPSEAEWIEFTVSRIDHLPQDAFSRFNKLRRLTFYHCDLKRIDPDAFRGLENLEWLLMSNTEIGLLRASLFRHLSNLRNLALDSAGLEYIEPEVFHSFRRLENLSLRDNDLDCLPIDAFRHLTRLKTVQIGENPWLCDCRGSIEKLINDRQIGYGPEEHLTTAIQDRSMKYSRRYYQCMAVLNYTALPVPEATFEDIERHNDGRYEWRETIVNSINDLSNLPTDLSWIQIFDVEIQQIPRYAFFKFGSTLRSIELINCGIRHIEREAFAGLHKLERLTMTGNPFTTVKHEWFRDLTRLNDLVLRHNAISSLDRNALEHLKSLKRLDLRENRLRCLDGHNLEGPEALERFEAAGNPWDCRCQQELENYLRRRRIGYGINDRCFDDVYTPDREDEYQFHRNASTTGRIRWCWAYQKSNWSPPSPTTTPRTTTQRIIKHTTTPRYGGCNIIRPSSSGMQSNCICRKASLNDLATLPATSEIIIFSASSVSTIHDYAFQRFERYLKQLEFHDCDIRKIESRAFYNLRVLETLVIRDNDLREVKFEWFEHLRNLKRLDLRGNGITRISFDVFERLPNLVYLDVSFNNMRCISIQSLEKLQYLRHLELEDNPWSCLCAKKLAEMMRERSIACKCNLDHLASKTECPDDPGYPPISDPVGPTMMPPRPRPTTTTEPPTIDFPTISPERANGTCYERKDDEQVVWYHCENGDLSILYKIPSYITKIEIIDSHIPNLPAMAFNRFPHLTELVLRNCTLLNVDPRAFGGLRKLVKLTIRENHFTTVKYEWFRDTRHLVWLDLSDNRLDKIQPGSFENLIELEYLNLQGNAFDCIYTDLFEDLPKLKNVVFGRNSLKSRCRAEIRQFLECRGIKYDASNCPDKCKSFNKYVSEQYEKSNKTGNSAANCFAFVSTLVITLFVQITGLCI